MKEIKPKISPTKKVVGKKSPIKEEQSDDKNELTLKLSFKDNGVTLIHHIGDDVDTLKLYASISMINQHLNSIISKTEINGLLSKLMK